MTLCRFLVGRGFLSLLPLWWIPCPQLFHDQVPALPFDYLLCPNQTCLGTSSAFEVCVALHRVCYVVCVGGWVGGWMCVFACVFKRTTFKVVSLSPSNVCILGTCHAKSILLFFAQK